MNRTFCDRCGMDMTGLPINKKFRASCMSHEPMIRKNISSLKNFNDVCEPCITEMFSVKPKVAVVIEE